MSSPPGSPEDAGKLRGGREGRQRREDDAPEQKRLRLGQRAGREPQDGETAPLPTQDELATHTGGEGRGVSNLGAAGTWVRAVVGPGMFGHRLVKLVTGQQLLQAHCAACLEGPPRDLDAWWQELFMCC